MLIPKLSFPPTLLLVLLLCCTVALGLSRNYTACLDRVIDHLPLNNTVTVTIDGNATTNISQIAGLTYEGCVSYCGHGAASFEWHTFSQEFASWLLPWLALISQLPYGTRDTLSNCLAVVLTVGSPTLAAYSLALSVISNRWMVRRLARSNYPNSRLAAQTLGNLQQVSLDIPADEHVLASLIVLQKNRHWWQSLAHGLDYSVPKWTLASIMTVIYVALADLFAWIDTLSVPFSNVTINNTGESVSSLWLCFLPIVIGNLQVSPKTDPNRIRRAFDQANPYFFVATDDDQPEQGRGSLLINVRTEPTDVIEEDELSTAPVYFYARAFTWLRLAQKVADSFDAASQHAANYRESGVPPSKRQDVVDYCKSDSQRNSHSYEIYSIFLRSAFLAIFLQWGTTGAALMAMFFTPTIGLGCRSGSYLLYGINSTLIWLLCILSDVFAECYKSFRNRSVVSSLIWGISLAFRHVAKIVAAGNAIWLFLTAILQFGNFYNSCWCNSSRLSLHGKAYTVITYTGSFLTSVKIAWGGGLAMAFSTAALFLIALNILRRRPAKEPESVMMQWMDPGSY